MKRTNSASAPENALTIFNNKSEIPSELRNLDAGYLLDVIEEAQGGNTYNLLAVYRDLISSDNQVMAEFEKRKGSVLGDTISIQPWDKKNPYDIAASELCSDVLLNPAFETMRAWLLNSALYPVAVVEKVFQPTLRGFKIKDLRPVPYRLLDYREGELRIYDTDERGNVLATTHSVDPARYIVHRSHTLPVPDNWGGPFRSILFWVLLRTMDRQWWADLLERFGTPFMKGKYKDADGKRVLEAAFKLAVRLGGIVVSQGTEVEIVQAAAGDSTSSHHMFLDVCNKEISKLIVGQTLSSTADPTGIGGGASGLQSEVREDIRKSDARLLSATIRHQLFAQLVAANGLSGNAPIIMFGADSASEINSLVGGVKALYEAGLEPDDDGLSVIQERVGYGIRRRQSAPAMMPFNAYPLSAAQPPPPERSKTDRLADVHAARDAALAEIVRTSKSSAEAIRRIKSSLENNPSDDASEILAEAMDDYAARALKSQK